MATRIADITPRSFPIVTPPNVKVAFVAGPAVAAVNSELAKMPAAVQARTLEDMDGGSDARHGDRIQVAAAALSAAMRQAFYHWLDVSLSFEAIDSQDDKVIDAGADLRDEAIRQLMDVPSLNDHDVALKVHIWAIDQDPYGSSFGPIGVGDGRGGFRADVMPIALGKDLLQHSPLSEVINDMAVRPPVTLPAELKRAAGEMGDSPWEAQYRDAIDAVGAMHIYERFQMNPVLAIHREMGANGIDQSGIKSIVAQREDEYGKLSGRAYRAIDALFLVPMPDLASFQLAMKLAEAAPMELCDDEGRLIAGVATSVDRLVAGHADDRITAGFATFRSCTATCKAGELLPSVEKETIDAMDLAVMELKEPAHTLQGVVAKLRAAFQGKVQNGWADHAVLDPQHPEFAKGLDMGDLYEQIMWSAIDDLSRIAGIDMAKQGA